MKKIISSTYQLGLRQNLHSRFDYERKFQFFKVAYSSKSVVNLNFIGNLDEKFLNYEKLILAKIFIKEINQIGLCFKADSRKIGQMDQAVMYRRVVSEPAKRLKNARIRFIAP